MEKTRRIYISKDTDDLTFLPRFCQRQGIILEAKSMIGFESIPFTAPEYFDVLLVNSIRAFDYFLQHARIPISCKIACVGSITAEKVEHRGYKVDFIGKNAGNPADQRKYLSRWLGGRSVLVPCSTISLRSITKEMPSDNLTEIKVYDTVLHPSIVADADLYIFTSPSNVQSYFLVNQALPGKVIAWGNSTATKLKEYEIEPYRVLREAKESELMETIGLLLNE